MREGILLRVGLDKWNSLSVPPSPTEMCQCIHGPTSFSGAREQRRIVVACSDLSPATMKYIAKSYPRAGKSMNFRP